MTNPRSPTLTPLLLPLLALTLLPVAVAAADPPPETPILRIETGMHTAPIRRIDVDAAGRFLITGSHDKTVRVWDLASGEPLRVLRPPIGEGNEGKIYAVAISPDGELVAAGGWTSPNGSNKNIYLFSRRTGRLLRRIAGLPNVVHHLAFSPGGSRLAATLGGANGLRVFRAADGEELHRDTEPEDDSYWADFDADGRLITTSFDGRLRLYGRDHRRLATAEAPGGKRPFAAAFSPDGRRIAVGYEDSTRVDVFSGDDLRLLYSAGTEGTNGDLSSVAWSAGGTRLFAAGRYHAGGKRPIRRWSDAGQGPGRDLEGPLNTVMGLHPLASGGLVFGSADPAWGVLDAAGERATFRGPSQADPRGLLDSFRVDRRGERLRFTYQPHAKRPALFSLPDRRLLLEPAASRPPPPGPRATPPPAPPPPLVLPPVVTVLDPADGAVVSTLAVKLRINVRSPSGAPVDAVHVAVDGRVVRVRDAEWPGTGDPDARDFNQEHEVPIPRRDCTVEVTAVAAGRISTPARVRLKWRDPPPPPRRRLRLLAAGVSVYADPAYRLGLAAKDASAVAAAFEALEGRLYQRVDSRLLRDGEATQRALLEGLQWLGEGLGAAGAQDARPFERTGGAPLEVEITVLQIDDDGAVRPVAPEHRFASGDLVAVLSHDNRGTADD